MSLVTVPRLALSLVCVGTVVSPATWPQSVGRLGVLLFPLPKSYLLILLFLTVLLKFTVLRMFLLMTMLMIILSLMMEWFVAIRRFRLRLSFLPFSLVVLSPLLSLFLLLLTFFVERVCKKCFVPMSSKEDGILFVLRLQRKLRTGPAAKKSTVKKKT